MISHASCSEFCLTNDISCWNMCFHLLNLVITFFVLQFTKYRPNNFEYLQMFQYSIICKKTHQSPLVFFCKRNNYLPFSNILLIIKEFNKQFLFTFSHWQSQQYPQLKIQSQMILNFDGVWSQTVLFSSR